MPIPTDADPPARPPQDPPARPPHDPLDEFDRLLGRLLAEDWVRQPAAAPPPRPGAA